jgi:hypothetical protein
MVLHARFVSGNPRSWFDMNQDIGNPRQLISYAVPHTARNVMRGSNRHFGIHFEVKVYVILQAGLSSKAFLDAGHVPHT